MPRLADFGIARDLRRLPSVVGDDGEREQGRREEEHGVTVVAEPASVKSDPLHRSDLGLSLEAEALDLVDSVEGWRGDFLTSTYTSGK